MTWRVETFTLTRKPWCPSARHRTICTQASRNTQVPTRAIRPVSSATVMNSPGGIDPYRGCSMRTRASSAANSPRGSPQRLIVDLEIAVVESFTDQARHFGRTEIDTVHLGVKDCILVFVLCLATIHGEVGEAVQSRGIFPMFGKQTDADTGRTGQFELIDEIRLAQAYAECSAPAVRPLRVF